MTEHRAEHCPCIRAEQLGWYRVRTSGWYKGRTGRQKAEQVADDFGVTTNRVT